VRDLRLAFRTLLRTPFVTSIAVLSLALGIGANAAIYSTFHRMLLAALPVREPSRLVNLNASGPNPGSQWCGQAGDCDVVFSYPMFRDLEKAQTPFTAIAAHWINDVNVAYGDRTSNTQAAFVSGQYFPVLGVAPELGRLLGPSDDQEMGGSPVAVLGYGFWSTQLGSDRHVLNTVIRVNGQPLTVVGVAPRGFEGTTLGLIPAVYVPVTMREVLYPLGGDATDRQSYWMYLFARLKPGVSIDQARAAINVPYHAVINDVEAPLQHGMSDATLARFKAKQIAVEDGRGGQTLLRGEVRPLLILLFVTTGIVLLIACANIANLLLARAANRASELAIRQSLGATRGQLLRQLLTESLALAALGGAASLLVGRWTLALMMRLLPADAAASMHIEMDPSAVWFTALLAIGTGLLFGLFPAVHSTRLDLDTVLRAGSAKLAGGRVASRFRTTLVTAQIALSMALLISAGLLVRSLRNVSRVDLGLRADSVVMFGVSPSLNGYSPGRASRLFADLEGALRAMPGAADVSAGANPLLVTRRNLGHPVVVQGFQRGPDVDNGSRYNVVGPGYFRTLGIPMLAGREFTAADGLGAPKVAIVNQAFARKFHLGSDVVGKFMGKNDSLDLQIVGLVKDAKYSEVKEPVPPVFFVPYRQYTTYGSLTFYVRAVGDPRAIERAIPGVVRHLDPTLPIEELRTVPEQVRNNVFLDRLLGSLAFAFAALATLLAAVGLYGVLAYSVAQRTREIGVRMALGADAGRIGRMVLRQVAVMTIVGVPIGIAGAIALGGTARSILFGVEGTDPIAIGGATCILAIVALAAGYLPAYRASRVDPVKAIRYE
jgi:putative ABC transport system permease protein